MVVLGLEPICCLTTVCPFPCANCVAIRTDNVALTDLFSNTLKGMPLPSGLSEIEPFHAADMVELHCREVKLFAAVSARSGFCGDNGIANLLTTERGSPLPTLQNLRSILSVPVSVILSVCHVWLARFELTAPAIRTQCSTKLSYNQAPGQGFEPR